MVPLVLGMLAAGIRLFAVWKIAPQPFDSENLRAGIALATGGVLANPYSAPTGPTAHVAPLYPALIAAAIGATGDVVQAMVIVRSMIAALFGVFVASLPKAAEAMGLGWGTGLLAALAFLPAGAPIFFAIETTGQSETPLVMIAAFALITTTVAVLRRGRLSVVNGALLGIAWGMGGLTSPVMLPVFPLLLVAALVLDRDLRGALPRFAAVAVLALMLTLAPWTLRNHRVLGGWMPVRDNLGLELGVSNMDGAHADMRENMRTTMRSHPFLSISEARRVEREGEVAYNSRRSHEALIWMQQHPQTALRLTLQRLGYFFLPAPARESHLAFYAWVLIFGSMGLLRLLRHDRFLALALSGAVVVMALPYALVQSSPRYSYPILWSQVLIASWYLMQLLSPVVARLRREARVVNGVGAR